jgi:hypothetical protein
MTLVRFLDLKHRDPAPDHEDAGEVCIANISPLERKKRLRFGIQAFILTIAILGVLIALQVNPLWRLFLLLLFWSSTSGYFQAREKT